MARAKVRLVLDSPGLDDLLKSGEVGDTVEEYGHQLANHADEIAGGDAEHSVVRFMGRDRVRVHVATANPAAMLAESRERALMRAYGMLSGGGGL